MIVLKSSYWQKLPEIMRAGKILLDILKAFTDVISWKPWEPQVFCSIERKRTIILPERKVNSVDRIS